MGISHLKALRRATDEGDLPLTWMAACSQQADFRVSFRQYRQSATTGRLRVAAFEPAAGTMISMASLHESVDFTTSPALPDVARGDVFRDCAFEGLDVEGLGFLSFDVIVVGCTFKKSAWYLSLFAMSRFMDVEFRGCVFRGCSFTDSVFARCNFVDCQFMKDNLGGECKFEDCAWYGCRQSGSEGLPESFVALQ